MVYTQPRICPGGAQTPLGFWDINWSSNHSQATIPDNNQQQLQQKENLQLVV